LAKKYFGQMKLSFAAYTLNLLHPFTIANFTRTTTPLIITKIEYENFVGYGEASMPPYLGETQQSAISFLKKVDLQLFKTPFEIENILKYVDLIAANNTAAKASIDIALHDLVGKILNKPWHQLYGVNIDNMPETSITIGIDNISVIKQKVKEASAFNVLKVKLGSNNDKEIIEAIRETTDKPICVDVNQGWTDKHFALDMIHWLETKNTLFVEQPLYKTKLDDTAWIKENSPLPIIADESVQRYADIEKIRDAFDGINIKLMKCTGMHEAYKMIHLARELDLKVLIGCMNESSCANLAAAQLAPFAEWVDLDGPFMITNNPFKNPTLEKGKIILEEIAGIGATLTKNLNFVVV